jgi:uncharacterized protein (DUF427 family)
LIRQRESVWDYPRPPRVEPCDRRVRVELGGEAIAESNRGLRVLETAGPPTIYVPLEDVRDGALRPAKGTTVCEWKGTASYFDAIYAGRVDACYLDDERVTPQPGDFYGGWITAEIDGPFKGEPGTEGW